MAPLSVPGVRPCALLSVSDKTGLTALAEALAGYGYCILASGGTHAALIQAGIAAEEVGAYTGFPEILEGRVKTLHPRVHAGLLAKGTEAHLATLAEHDIPAIDILAVNLYPFEETRKITKDEAALVEKIDVGGPAMTRAGAKNFGRVAVLTDPADYPALLEELACEGGRTSLAFRRRMAAKAFRRTAAYDAHVAAWFTETESEPFPERFTVSGTLAGEGALRYGENPHQAGAFYRLSEAGLGGAKQVQGKPLSYNNIADADAAMAFTAGAEAPCAVIVKHANPCGGAEGKTLAEAYAGALACDPVSAFGGVAAFNREPDAATAEAVAALFCEVIIAPGFSPEALAVLAPKKNLRLLVASAASESEPVIRSVSGGLLVQQQDAVRVTRDRCRVVTKRAPTDEEWADLLFAFRAVRHVRSNAIVLAKGRALVGVGAGQMSRVDSAMLACRKAVTQEGIDRARGAVAASDAFFPFADGAEALCRAGVTALIQPGGSKRDAEVIEAADQAGAAMVFTDLRCFKH